MQKMITFTDPAAWGTVSSFKVSMPAGTDWEDTVTYASGTNIVLLEPFRLPETADGKITFSCAEGVSFGASFFDADKKYIGQADGGIAWTSGITVLEKELAGNAAYVLIGVRNTLPANVASTSIAISCEVENSFGGWNHA